MAIEGTGAHCPHEIMRMGVRGSVAYPLRTRHVEARMAACGVDVDHAPRHRRTSTESPRLAEALHRRTRPVGGRGRMAETSITVKGPGRTRCRPRRCAPGLFPHRTARHRGRMTVAPAGQPPP